MVGQVFNLTGPLENLRSFAPMSFRSTTFLFGLLLGMLWLFGLTVSYKKTAVDASVLLPTLEGSPDTEIDSITIQRRVAGKPPEELQFTKNEKDINDKDVWTLKVPGVQKSVKVESFRVEQIIRQIKEARRSDEAEVSDKLATVNLDPPATVVTLRGKVKGKKEQEWKFYMGKESADQAFVFVNSSDRPNKVYAMTKSNIDSVLFKDPNHLRARRLFEFTDTAAQTIDVKEGAAELDLKKGDDSTWRFEKPAFGAAEFEGPPAPKDLAPGAKTPEGGVKGLLASIGTIRVDSEDDFVPISDEKLAKFGLEEGKESLRIAVGTLKDKGDKKEIVKEFIAIGARVENKPQVYARMVGDEGVFKLNSKLLEPIKVVVENPGSLRSTDVVSLDPKKVDAVTEVHGKDNITLLHPDGKPWEIEINSSKAQKANQAAATAFVEALQGKRGIVKFYDGDDFKKLDAELKTPSAVVTLFTDALKESKKDAKKDAPKKDEKKDEKKDDAVRLPKDAKPALTLTFGAADKDTVNVHREAADGTKSRFAISRALFDKIVPADLTLAFLDTALPELATDEIDRVVVSRDKDKLDFEKGWGEHARRWFFKEGEEPPGKNATDAAKTTALVQPLSALHVQKWLRKIDPKEDLSKLGLAKPALEITFYIKKDRPVAAASLMGLLATPTEWRGLLAEAVIRANRTGAPAEKVVLKVGKETEDRGAFYAERTDSAMLFTVPAELVRSLREADLRDRSGILLAQPLISSTILARAGGGARQRAAGLVAARLQSRAAVRSGAGQGS